MGIQSGLISNKLHTESDEAELFPDANMFPMGVGVGGGKTGANPDNIVGGNYSALVGTAPALPMFNVEQKEEDGTTKTEDDDDDTGLGQAKELKNLTEEQREQKVKNMIAEFLSSADVNEAMYCVEELGGASKCGSMLTVKIVSQLVEALERDAKTLVKLVVGLSKGSSKTSCLSKDDVVNAIHEQTSQLDDLAIDVPLAPKNLGELIAGCVLDGDQLFNGEGFSFSIIESLLSPVEDAMHKRSCFAFLCAAITREKGEATLVKIVKESETDLPSLLEGDPEFDESYEDFLNSKNLSVLI